MMPGFGPWVWKKVEHRSDLIGTEHEFESLTSSTEVAKIFMLQLIQFLGHTEASLKPVVETDEIDFWIFLAILHHEFTITGANFDFDGLIITKQHFPFSDI
jgi:hypothetical protein